MAWEGLEMSAGTRVGLDILAEVFVNGHAKTKGSLTVVDAGKGHLREKPGTDAWRDMVSRKVRAYAEDATGLAGFEPFPGRVGVWIVTYMQREVYLAGSKTGGLPAWLERMKAWLISPLCGDVDKLARCVLDALTDSGVIVDDAQVVDLTSSKRICMPGSLPGQMIKVYAIPDERPW